MQHSSKYKIANIRIINVKEPEYGGHFLMFSYPSSTLLPFNQLPSIRYSSDLKLQSIRIKKLTHGGSAQVLMMRQMTPGPFFFSVSPPKQISREHDTEWVDGFMKLRYCEGLIYIYNIYLYNIYNVYHIYII